MSPAEQPAVDPASEPAPPRSSDPPPPASPTARFDVRVAAVVENWKRKLLDLTRRNRALNFRPNKVSTLTIVDEQPSEVFRHLVLLEKPFRFKAAPEPEPPASEPPPLPLDFVPYDSASPSDRHADDSLQTTSSPDALDKSLRRLDEMARSSLEEQGVNTLFLTLGMLQHRASPDSDQVDRAPLILIPVRLSRKSARSGFFLTAIDEEPIVNPALVEHLRRQHAVVLPELPDAKEMAEEWDLQPFLLAARDAIAGKAGWSLTTEIQLAPFSFQKFVMYKDLEANAAGLTRHRLLRQLVTRDGEHVVGIPDDIRRMDLDEEYPPERTLQVVDADASQLRAIAAAARANDLVIEGPPGTGKSQTITNLIAQALAAGRTVLFVAEKMAALSVVHERLRRIGLGEFCLALHSTKANKREVMRELAATLDASLETIPTRSEASVRLPAVRRSLTEYARAVHAPFGTLALSPYRAYGELAAVLAAPRVTYSGPIDGPVDGAVTPERFTQTLRDLQDLGAASAGIGNPAEHPWRDAGKTLYTGDDLEAIRVAATELGDRIARLRRDASAVSERLGLPPIPDFAGVATAASIASLLRRSPGAPLAVLQSESWNRPPPEARRLLDLGRTLTAGKRRLGGLYVEEAFTGEHAQEVGHVRRTLGGVLSFLAFLDARYRAIRSRWRSLRRPGHAPTMAQQAADLDEVDQCRAAETELRDAESRARELFGALWNGPVSDWAQLESYVQWVVEFRGACVQHALGAKAIEAASRGAVDVGDVDGLVEAASEARQRIARLAGLVGAPDGWLTEATIEAIEARARALAAAWKLGPPWAAFVAARRSAEKSLGAECVLAACRGELAFADLVPAFRRGFFAKWLAEVVQSRPALERFQVLTHEERVAEFRSLDEQVLRENRAALVARLRERVQTTLRQPEVTAQLPHLRREMAKQRRLSPLRRTMKLAADAVRAIKPCWMMSPLTVAQLLEGAARPFDLVIFDEASQLPPEDAVGAIFRGSQLVVVGDPKQLPPTTFFVAGGAADAAELDEDGEPTYEDSESILEEFMGAGVPMSRLKWHYRSAHESLISFSNRRFYDADLHTFPSVEIGNAESGLQFEHVPDGRYEGKGLNAIEARRVADEVARFAKEQLERAARGEKRRSLGVGTFNLRQQIAIQDEIEARRRADPAIEPFFDRPESESSPEPFFVKNLENIQGDERDVIFISVTYGRGTDGKLRLNFGPINGTNGWRRLNVLTTRARQRMKVFSSMRGEEIQAASAASQGPQLLREFLVFAERGRFESASESLKADAESPFEREIVEQLLRRDVKVVPQVGVAGYRIDLGILDDEVPGRFVCGIECDGAAYHAAETARDRDRLRQQVLEARGWTIHRVWSTDWFKDRNGQIERLLALIAASRNDAKDAANQARAAAERATAEAARLAQEKEEERRRQVAELVAPRSADAYQRPVAPRYAEASLDRAGIGSDLASTPIGEVVRALVSVVEAESPVHEDDVFARIAAIWDLRLGSRVQGRIAEACRVAETGGLLRRRGLFLWSLSAPCRVRSRAGTKIAAERIAPEEYRQAVLEVLAKGHAFSRAQLVTEVRAMLGFHRTGAALDEAINAAIDGLLASSELGEGGTGIRRRERS